MTCKTLQTEHPGHLNHPNQYISVVHLMAWDKYNIYKTTRKTFVLKYPHL